MLQIDGKSDFKTIEGMSELFKEHGQDLLAVYKEFMLKLSNVGINPAYHSFIFEQVSDISKILCSQKYNCQNSPDTLGTKLDYLFDGLFSASRYKVLP